MSQASRGLYSLIQFVPDTGRAEAANIGVVLFLPSQNSFDFCISESLTRVRKFFAPGRAELEEIQIALNALRKRLEVSQFTGQEDFEHFIAARADVVRLTKPRVATVIDPKHDVKVLYQELVRDHSENRRSPVKPTIPDSLRRVLDSLKPSGKVWEPGKIKIPTIDRKLEISMAYVNGVVNYVRAEQIIKGAKLETKLERLGFDGQLIHTYPVKGQASRLVVLSSDSRAEPKSESKCESVLANFHVRFVPFNKAAEFAHEVEATAH
jgi:hypothetical protein